MLFAGALKKIYDVPVYYTKIDLVTIDSKAIPGKELNINIIRDYDRPNKRTYFTDSVYNYYYKLSDGDLSGIYYNGLFCWCPDSTNVDTKKRQSVMNEVNEIMSRYNVSHIVEPYIVYISITTSYRQSFHPYYGFHREDTATIKNRSLVFNYYDGDTKRVDTINYIDNFSCEMRKNIPETFYSHKIGCHVDHFLTASKNDERLFVNNTFTTNSHQHPNVLFTAEDVSKIVEIIQINDGNIRDNDSVVDNCQIKSLKFDYLGPSEFSDSIIPQPDEMRLNYIRYTDKHKIDSICRYGLRYHVKFPDMENTQEARVFIVSGFLTGMAALLFRYLYRLFCDVYRWLWDPKSNRNNREKLYFITFIICLFALLMYLVFWANVNPSTLLELQ